MILSSNDQVWSVSDAFTVLALVYVVLSPSEISPLQSEWAFVEPAKLLTFFHQFSQSEALLQSLSERMPINVLKASFPLVWDRV